MDRKEFSICTAKRAKNGKDYFQEVGNLQIVEEEENQRHYLDLYMYPDTKFFLKEKIFN